MPTNRCPGPLACLSVVLLSLSLPQAYGEGNTYYVTAQEPGPTTCVPNEPTPPHPCSLESAWENAEVNDTIILLKDRMFMDKPLGGSKGGGFKGRGVISIVCPHRHFCAVAGGEDFRFMEVYLPFNYQAQVQLHLSGFTIQSYNYTVKAEDHVVGGVVCLSNDPSGTQCNTAPRPLEEQQMVEEGGRPHYDTGFPALKVVNVAVSNNYVNDTVASKHLYLYGGSFGLAPGTVPSRVVFQGCTFTGNTVMLRYNSIIGAIFGSGANWSPRMYIPLDWTKTKVDSNLVEVYDRAYNAPAGALVVSAGDIYVEGGSFGSNSAGESAGLIYSGGVKFSGGLPKTIYGNVTANGTTFIFNKATGSTIEDAAYVTGAHLHMLNVKLVASPGKIAGTFSDNDQYFSDCILRSAVGRPLWLNGFQIFNRNPLSVIGNLNTTGAAGFAGCSQGQMWYSCPEGTTCKDHVQDNGQVVGYNCESH